MKKLLTVLLTFVMVITLINLNTSQIKADDNKSTRFTITATEDGVTTISIKKTAAFGTGWTPNTLYISIDGAAPTAYSYDNNIQINKNQRVAFTVQADNGLCFNIGNYVNFISDKEIKASGNTMSLLWTDFANKTDFPSGTNFAFVYLFKECSKLISIDDLVLPATTLKNYCYWAMFTKCTGLTSIPEDLLPATTLVEGCYQSMFYSCANLTNIPKLPATTLADNCYQAMFSGCTNLSNVISETQVGTFTEASTIPTSGTIVTSGTTNCTTNMFANTGLTTATPDLGVGQKFTYYKVGAPLPTPAPEAGEMPYDNTNGFNATITKGLATSLTAHIDNVTKGVDTVEVKKGDTPLTLDTDYKIEDGSIKVVFQPSYLNSLDAGDTTLKILINSTNEFKVTITSQNPPPVTPPSPTPTPTPISDPEQEEEQTSTPVASSVGKDTTCEAVIGQRWHWDEKSKTCKEEYSVINTATK